MKLDDSSFHQAKMDIDFEELLDETWRQSRYVDAVSLHSALTSRAERTPHLAYSDAQANAPTDSPIELVRAQPAPRPELRVSQSISALFARIFGRRPEPAPVAAPRAPAANIAANIIEKIAETPVLPFAADLRAFAEPRAFTPPSGVPSGILASSSFGNTNPPAVGRDVSSS